MKNIAYLALAALSVALFGQPAAAQSDTLQKIKEAGVIKLGGRDASFPFSYKVNADGHPIGFSADLCMKVVDAVRAKLRQPQLKVEYQIVTPANRIPLVENGTIDLECSTTTNTTARAQQVDFAPTHFVSGIGVAINKSSGIRQMSDLAGKTVAMVTASTSVPAVRAYKRANNLEFSDLMAKDVAEAFLLLQSGRASAMVLDDIQLAGLIARSEKPADYQILDVRLRDEAYGFIFRKDDPKFKALVDETLSDAMRSGEVQGLYEKWFQRPVPPQNVNLSFPMTQSTREAYRAPNNKAL